MTARRLHTLAASKWDSRREKGDGDSAGWRRGWKAGLDPKAGAFRSRVSAGISENAELEYKGESGGLPDIYAYKHNTLPFPVARIVRATYTHTHTHASVRAYTRENARARGYVSYGDAHALRSGLPRVYHGVHFIPRV